MKSPELIRWRQRRRKQSRNSLGKRAIQVALVLVAIALAFSVGLPATAAAAAAGVYSYLTSNLPNPDAIKTVQDTFQTTTLYDRNGKLLYEVIDETAGDSQWVPLNQISPYLRCAVVSSEDRRFYDSSGIDLRGLARAVVNNITGGQTQGASGIVQQLVKNVITPPEERSGIKRTTTVKIREALLATEIARRYSRDQLLEWYLNTNFYGNLAYGIQAASRVYFNKDSADLTLAEAAMLTHIPQFPAQNPIDSPNEAKVRQGIILDAMIEGTDAKVRDCAVTEKQAEDAKQESLRLAQRQTRFNIQAPHFSVYARDRAVEILADHLGVGTEAATELVNRGGLRITTSLDLDTNNQLQKFAQEQVLKLQRDNKKANNSSIVVIKPSTGEVIAMVGSIDYYNDTIDGKFNVALGLRQPGSSFKPITYLELLRQGASPATLFWDTRTTFPTGGATPYTPENYDRKYHGPVRMRQVLSRSYNIPAVDALNRAGIGNVIRLAHKLGITNLDKGLDFYGLALTLGGGEVKLLDMTYLYSVIANGGTMNGAPRPAALRKGGYRDLDPAAILRIEDSKGNVLYSFESATNPKLLGPKSEQLTYQITSMLSDPQSRAAAFGYPSTLDLAGERPAAVKTGTTNDNKDNWTIGFTPDYVVGVWVGNTNNESMDQSVTGVTGAAPIWKQVMEYLHSGKPNKSFTKPDGLITRAVCSIDGLLPNGACPSVNESFIEGTVPTQVDTMVQRFPINKDTGKIALPGTPPDKVEEKILYIFPPQAQDWLDGMTEDEKKLYPLAPTELDTQFGGVAASGDVAIAYPPNGAYIRGTKDDGSPAEIEIRGNAKGGNWVSYKIAFAAGFDPAPDKWQQIGPDHPEQVDNNVLERFNLASIPPGLYSLRLTRVEQDNRVTEYVTRFTIDITPPKAKIAQPFAGQLFTAPGDEWIDINADVTDDNRISKVEFFVNNDEKPFATKTSAPYSIKWTIPPGFTGQASIRVVAYDGAGNKAESPRVGVAVTYKK